MLSFGDLKIIVSEHALADTDERLFPASRHRSARIFKKLVKRYGGVFRKKPVAYRIGNSLVMHPALYDELRRQFPGSAPSQGSFSTPLGVSML